MNSRTASKTEEVRASLVAVMLRPREEIWDWRASPVDVILSPREWILVMVGEKSMLRELFFAEKLTNAFAETILIGKINENKTPKTKSPSRNLDDNLFFLKFLYIISS